MNDTYKIAGKIIELNSIYKDVHTLCNNYRYDGTADFYVKTTQADIDSERQKYENHKYHANHCYLTDGYLETLAVYRKIAEKMLEFNIVLFHGSVIAVDGRGYMFTAKSGTGKSTHAKLWKKYFGSRAVIVNDDKPLLGISKNQIIAYGTPWCGKHRLNSNICVPMKAICILNRSENNYIHKISAGNAYYMLLQQVYRPLDSQLMLKTLNLLDVIANNISIYESGCNMNIEAAKITYNGMQ